MGKQIVNHYVGVDIGYSGAIAIITEWPQKKKEVVQVWSMPLVDQEKKDYDLSAIFGIFDRYLYPESDKDEGIRMVVIEALSYMPGWSKQTVIGLTECVSIFSTLLAIHKVPTRILRPAKWQQGLFGEREEKTTKEASVDYVAANHKSLDLYRTAKGRKSINADHNKADAICMAAYAKQLAREMQ